MSDTNSPTAAQLLLVVKQHLSQQYASYGLTVTANMSFKELSRKVVADVKLLTQHFLALEVTPPMPIVQHLEQYAVLLGYLGDMYAVIEKSEGDTV